MYLKYLDVWSCSFESHFGLFAHCQEIGVDVPPENGHRLANVLGAEIASGVDPQEGEPRGHHDEEKPEQEHEQAAAKASAITCKLIEYYICTQQSERDNLELINVNRH